MRMRLDFVNLRTSFIFNVLTLQISELLKYDKLQIIKLNVLSLNQWH